MKMINRNGSTPVRAPYCVIKTLLMGNNKHQPWPRLILNRKLLRPHLSLSRYAGPLNSLHLEFTKDTPPDGEFLHTLYSLRSFLKARNHPNVLAPNSPHIQNRPTRDAKFNKLILSDSVTNSLMSKRVYNSLLEYRINNV